MTLTIAVFAQGEMGAGVAGRLTERGARIKTSLEGRSEASLRRAAAAGMEDAPFEALAEADMFLSIAPPGQALPIARRIAAAGRRAPSKLVYADCNAVSPATAREIAAALPSDWIAFVDAGIIGSAPKPDQAGPRIHASGPDAEALCALRAFGLDIRRLDGPIGAASALKMAYGGITKGMTAIGAAMALAAERAGAAEALQTELMASQQPMRAWLARQCLGMIPKAYRWVDEMEEIAAFHGDDAESARLYHAIADLFARLAKDAQDRGEEAESLRRFFG